MAGSTQNIVATDTLSARPPAASPATGLAVGLLDTLATRFREGGLFLVVLNPQGALTYSDPAAASFFAKFVLPALRCPPLATASDFATLVRQTGTASVPAPSPLF